MAKSILWIVISYKSPAPAVSQPERFSRDEEAAALMSNVKADLVDWSLMARPAEGAFVALATLLLIAATLGSDWLVGASSDGHMLRIGLHSAYEDGESVGSLEALINFNKKMI